MAKAKRNRTFGELPPRYSFILNPYTDVRLSKCPQCSRPTHQRKFPLVIVVREWGPFVLGKTCRYCSRCELVMVHQDELEEQLAHAFHTLAPEQVGNEYLVIGSMEKKVWDQRLAAGGGPLDELLKHVADFKHVLDLEVQGGWGPA
jgi:hypothetical protein